MSFTHAPIGTTYNYRGTVYMKILNVEVQTNSGAFTVPSTRNAVAISGIARGILVHWTEEGGFVDPWFYRHHWRWKSRLEGWSDARWTLFGPFLRFYELYRNWNLYKRIILTWWEEST